MFSQNIVELWGSLDILRGYGVLRKSVYSLCSLRATRLVLSARTQPSTGHRTFDSAGARSYQTTMPALSAWILAVIARRSHGIRLVSLASEFLS